MVSHRWREAGLRPVSSTHSPDQTSPGHALSAHLVVGFMIAKVLHFFTANVGSAHRCPPFTSQCLLISCSNQSRRWQESLIIPVSSRWDWFPSTRLVCCCCFLKEKPASVQHRVYKTQRPAQDSHQTGWDSQRQTQPTEGVLWSRPVTHLI